VGCDVNTTLGTRQLEPGVKMLWEQELTARGMRNPAGTLGPISWPWWQMPSASNIWP